MKKERETEQHTEQKDHDTHKRRMKKQDTERVNTDETYQEPKSLEKFEQEIRKKAASSQPKKKMLGGGDRTTSLKSLTRFEEDIIKKTSSTTRNFSPAVSSRTLSSGSLTRFEDDILRKTSSVRTHSSGVASKAFSSRSIASSNSTRSKHEEEEKSIEASETGAGNDLEDPAVMTQEARDNFENEIDDEDEKDDPIPPAMRDTIKISLPISTPNKTTDNTPTPNKNKNNNNIDDFNDEYQFATVTNAPPIIADATTEDDGANITISGMGDPDDSKRKRSILSFRCLLVVMIFLAIAFCALFIPITISNTGSQNNEQYTENNLQQLASVISNMTAITVEDLLDVHTPQGAAMYWIANIDNLKLTPESPDHLLQRWTLMVLFYGRESVPRDEENDIDYLSMKMESYQEDEYANPDKHECDWNVVMCDDVEFGIQYDYESEFKEEDEEDPQHDFYFNRKRERNRFLQAASTKTKNDIFERKIMFKRTTTENEITIYRGNDTEYSSNKKLRFVVSGLRISQNVFFMSYLCDEVRFLKEMRYLNIAKNKFEGVIPSVIYNLTNLEYLKMNKNQFSGYIDKRIGNLKSLKTLNLRGNKLSGSLPTSIQNLVNLRRLYLNKNSFSGNVLEHIVNMPNIELISLAYNGFSGTFPSLFGNLSKLHFFDVGTNKFSGSLPSGLGSLSRLETFIVEKNRELSGSLSVEIGKWVDCAVIDFDACDLSGSIPTELGSLQHLIFFSAENNNVGSTLPTELGNLHSIQVFSLASNALEGTIPTEFGNMRELRVLHFEGNGLTGPIPSELGQLENLETLGLHGTKLDFGIPPEVCALQEKKLIKFEVSSGDTNIICLEGGSP